MECDICITERDSFMVCRLCDKKWCETCYDSTISKQAYMYHGKLYIIKRCPWCRHKYIYGSRLASPGNIKLNGSSVCVIT